MRLAHADDDLIGATVAGYRIEAVAGRGSMGTVYRATGPGSAQPVALKLIAPGLAGRPAFAERFRHEAEVARSVVHPNVVPLIESGEIDGRPFIAMAFVEGADLDQLLAREGRLEPDEAARIALAIADGLDVAHRRGLVHRDVKPANVLIANGSRDVFLTDFGISKPVDGESGLTLTGTFVGVADYVAPEQILGKPAGAAADVYALGCLMFHALEGRPPFARETEVGAIYAKLNEAPARPSGASPALAAVLARALARDPAHRYRDAADFGRALREALAAGDAGPPPPAERPAPVTPSAGPPPHAGAPRRRRTALTGLAIAALLGAGAALALIVGGGGDASPPTRPAPGPKTASTISVPGRPDGIAVAADGVFVVTSDTGRLVRIDQGRAVDTAPAGTDPDSVVVDKGVAWTTARGDALVRRYDVESGRLSPVGDIPTDRAPDGIALGKQLAWVVSEPDDSVARIDRATPTGVGPPIAVGRRPADVFVGSDWVWIANSGDDTVTRIDSSTSELVGAPIAVGDGPRGLVEAFGSVWVANARGDTVTRLDARTGSPVGAPIPVGRDPRELAAGHGIVWVANRADATVTRLDGRTGKAIGRPIAVGRQPVGIAVGPDAVWVANHRDRSVSRIPLR